MAWRAAVYASDPASAADRLAYWQRIQPALAQIVDASRTLKDSRSQGVWISMPPSFAAKWFMRRMARFVTRHPEVELHLNSSAALVDFERDKVDLAIRRFNGNAPDLDATLLYPDQARAYCSPAYAKALALVQPDDLLRATLLHTTLLPYWAEWLRQFSQLQPAQSAGIAGIHFDQGLMAIEAAKQGQGVVIASPMLTEEETADGTLIEPFAQRLPLAGGYYVVHPRKSALRAAPQAFKAWLIAEAAGGLAS
jgi:LysR family transcriptional regulator, glycine cleavage system transcriptional activator